MPTIHRPDGAHVAYHCWGRDDRTPVVLVQGLGVSSRGWVFQRGPFARRYRVVAPDNRGTGGSSVPVGPLSLVEIADDVVAVMDAEGIETAHVVGVSMGGIVAQVIGVEHPERVRSLTLASTSCHHHAWRRELLAETAGAVVERGMGALADEALGWLVGPRVRKRLGFWLDGLARILLSGDPRGFVHQVDAILAMDDEFRFRLAEISVPVLVLAGSQDSLTPVGDSEEIAELVPGARLVVVSGAAHGMMAEAPNAFNATVLEFLADVDRAVSVSG